MTTPIRSMDELIAALRARLIELQLTHSTVDGIAGLQDGYTSKLLAPKPIKNLGPVSFQALLGALGVAVVVVEDPEQIKRVEGRWTKRERPLRTPKLLTASTTASIEAEAPLQLQVTPAMKRLIENPEWLKNFTSSGGRARAIKLSPTKRARIAKKAARIRWQRERERRSAPQPEMA